MYCILYNIRIRIYVFMRISMMRSSNGAILMNLAGLGRMYPSVEGANGSIRHELLGPNKSLHEEAWFIESTGWARRLQIFVACPRGCAVALGWREGVKGAEVEGWQEMGPWLISSHIGQGKQGAVVCTGRWPGAGSGGVAAVKYPMEIEELELYARVHDIPGLPAPRSASLCLFAFRLMAFT